MTGPDNAPDSGSMMGQAALAAADGPTFNLARDSLLAHEPVAGLTRVRRRAIFATRKFANAIDLALIWKRRWFIVTMILGFALMYAPTPSGLTHDGQIVLVMSLMATLLFITEPVPLPSVALLIVVGRLCCSALDSTKVAKSLMTDSVLFIMGLLMLAVAVVKQKLDKRIALAIVRMTGTSVFWISFGIVAVCGSSPPSSASTRFAAMMLPVGVTLISLTSNDPKKVHNLAAVILFSISFGCSIAGVTTPSGGARNAIIISYWKGLLLRSHQAETWRYLMDYITWIIYALPMFLLRLPLVSLLLILTFKPETSDLSRAVTRLRTQVKLEGPMKMSGWLTILVFAPSSSAGPIYPQRSASASWRLPVRSPISSSALCAGRNINSGVNWGIVLLYAAAISLASRMRRNGSRNGWPMARCTWCRRSAEQHRCLRGRHLAHHRAGLEHHDGGGRSGGAFACGAENVGCRPSRSSDCGLPHAISSASVTSRQRPSPPSPSSMPRAI